MNAPASTTSTALVVATLWRRELVRFVRDRGRVVGALGTPLVFWLLIGSGFDQVFRTPNASADGGYMAFFFPGIVVLVVLFTAIFSTFSVIEDRQLGFLQGVLVTPVTRTSIVLGKVLGGATLAVAQAMVFLMLAPVVGISLTVGRVAATAGILTLLAIALTAFGFALAWGRASTQGFHSIMNLLLMPMWLLSGAVFPAETAPGWLWVCMVANPLTYGMAALRAVLEPAATGAAFPSLPVALGVTTLFLLASVWASARAVHRG